MGAGAIAMFGVIAAAPVASAQPPTREVQVACDDGSTFTTQLVLPDSGNGLSSVYRIERGSGTGAAAEAVGFAWFQRVVLNPDGSTAAVTGSVDGVDHGHDLVSCTHPGLRNPDRTFVLTGFFVP